MVQYIQCIPDVYQKGIMNRCGHKHLTAGQAQDVFASFYFKVADSCQNIARYYSLINPSYVSVFL